MALLFTHWPLDRMDATQEFGVKGAGLPTGGSTGTYADLGLKGHNGLDLATGPSGKSCYAVYDGYVERDGNVNDKGYGLLARLYIPTSADTELEVVYAHLQEVVKTGPVKAGDWIGVCDNSGMSTGPHLHIGVRLRVRQGSGWQVLNHDNGYLGYMDPRQFFPKQVTESPVDRQYGFEDSWARRVSFAPHWLYLIRSGIWNRMNDRQFKALKFGNWDLRTVLDYDLFSLWGYYSKPEAQKRGLVK